MKTYLKFLNTLCYSNIISYCSVKSGYVAIYEVGAENILVGAKKNELEPWNMLYYIFDPDFRNWHFLS